MKYRKHKLTKRSLKLLDMLEPYRELLENSYKGTRNINEFALSVVLLLCEQLGEYACNTVLFEVHEELSRLEWDTE